MVYLSLRSLWMRRSTYTLVLVEIMLGLLSLTLSIGVWDDARQTSRHVLSLGPAETQETWLVNCSADVVEQLASAVRGDPGAATVGTVYVPAEGVRAIGAEAAQMLPLRVKAGRWFSGQDFQSGRSMPSAVLGSGALPSLAIGDMFTKPGLGVFTIVGRLQRGQYYWDATSNDSIRQVTSTDELMFIPVAATDSAGTKPSMMARLWVVPKQFKRASAVVNLGGILRQTPTVQTTSMGGGVSNCNYSRPKSMSESLQAYYDGMRPMLYMTGFIAAVILSIGLIGLTGVMMITLEQRSREFALRLAMGATGADLVKQLLGEMLFLYSFATVPTIALGYVLVARFQLDVSLMGYVLVAIVGLLTVLVSSLTPVLVVYRKPPVYFIHNGR